MTGHDLRVLSIEFTGSAESPQTLPWKKNANSKTVDEAEEFAETHGATFPDDVRYVLTPLNATTYAAYTIRVHTFAEELWYWKDFLNEDEEIVLRLRPDVLDSD